MRDTVENEMCDRLAEVLGPIEVGGVIEASPAFEYVLGVLENYVTHIIREAHRDFAGAVDGWQSVVARKAGPRAIELLGEAYLISGRPDMVTLVHLRLQIDPSQREVCWMECRLGVQENGRLASLSPPRLRTVFDRVEREGPSGDWISWAYQVGFGER